MLSVIVLFIVMLEVIMPSVVMLRVMAPMKYYTKSFTVQAPEPSEDKDL